VGCEVKGGGDAEEVTTGADGTMGLVAAAVVGETVAAEEPEDAMVSDTRLLELRLRRL